MIRVLRAVCCIALLAVAGTSVNAAQTWQVGTADRVGHYSSTRLSAWFVFSAGTLEFKGVAGTTSSMLGCSSSAWTTAQQYICTYGIWAVCGTVSNNQLVRDPYASFVATSNCTGYITWAADTPEGYIAPLMLGADFEGCGGNKGPNDWGRQLTQDSTIIWKYSAEDSYVGYGAYSLMDPGSHTFYTSQSGIVPEPASILSILAGVGGMAGIALRRRK